MDGAIKHVAFEIPHNQWFFSLAISLSIVWIITEGSSKHDKLDVMTALTTSHHSFVAPRDRLPIQSNEISMLSFEKLRYLPNAVKISSAAKWLTERSTA